MLRKDERTDSKILNKDYRLVNFLYAFHKKGFEFLKDEPKLLVEKVFSVDPNWIGNAAYEMYGHEEKFNNHYVQSEATKVPCLEGEWVVVCYKKETKREEEDGIWYGSEWHRYYLCQIDFNEEHLFKIIGNFEHIYDAFKYLYENKLVAIKKSDERYKKQITVRKADIAIEVLSGCIEDENYYNYEEMLRLFAENANKSEEVKNYMESKYFPNFDEKNKKMNEIEEIKCYFLMRYLPKEPFENEGEGSKMKVKQYLDTVKEFKENYIWNI